MKIFSFCFALLSCFVAAVDFGFAQEKVDIQREIEKYFQNNPLPLNASSKPAFSQDPKNPLRLLDISFISINDLSTSTASVDEFRSLHFGHHDPKNLGFTAANQEIALSGVVDPYFRGDAFIVYSIDEEGESVFELEEAYLTSLALPQGMQLRFGQFFTAFGRQNTQHPHNWGFVDQPVVLSRMMGADGGRGPGAELSFTLPTPFFSELLLSAQNSFGETAFSFQNAEGEFFAGRELGAAKVRSLAEMLYLARFRSSFEISEETTLVVGASGLFGPNSSGLGPNSTGESKRTHLYGLDIYWKWKPLDAEQGFPFVSVQSEWLTRKYEAGSDSAAGLPEDSLHDWGQYTQVLYGFRRGWVAGLRHEFARGNADNGDFLRERRTRLSPNITYYPSEFSKLRLQYNYDRSGFLEDPSHSIILQFEIGFGVHGAHKF